PPVETKASGWFKAVYRPSTKVLEYRLNLVGLSGPVTMAYLHGPAPAGQNAQQVVPINPPFYSDGSTISDGVTLTKEQADQLLAGQWYISVRTAKHPDGEIRGQIAALKK
ncbi:CHRD domain-containing protein, partial [Acinetobacter baumannii]|nr:CHRD domain-containing protein [Acinetobacter baumannii]